MGMRGDRKVLWLLVLIAYTMFIFANSMTPAVESSRQSGYVLGGVQRMLASLGVGEIGITEHIIRKLAHFTEYAGLGLLLCQAVKGFFSGRERRYVTALLGCFIPFADETIQLFVEGRSGQISDVWLDMSGVLFGTLLWYLVQRRRKTGR